ncbi:MAG: hypothetical protein ACERKN_07750 [Velocimicrobium sp.]
MIKKKMLWMFLSIVVIMITVACGNREDDKKNKSSDEETVNSSSSQEENLAEKTSPISTESNKITEIESDNYTILNSSETKFEDLSFIHEDIYKVFSKKIGDIDFNGIFENGDVADSETILKKYYKVVVGEEPYINEAKEKEEYEGEFDSVDPNDCSYYYFDMDNDGLPELIIFDHKTYEYIFKYDTEKNEVMLISIIRTTSQLLGNNKISYWSGGIGLTYGYYELDDAGERNSEIRFYSSSYLNDKTQQEDEIYMVGYPKDSEEIKTFHQNEKVEVYFDELTETYYFKMTEKQYNQLTKDYFRSRKEAEENIKEVTYTFKKLFGQFK